MSRRQVFYDLLSELEQERRKDTDKLFDKLQENYGLRHQSYVNYSLAAGRQNALDLHHTFPEEFVKLYKEKDLHLTDPIAQSGLSGIKPVHWQKYRNEPSAKFLFSLASQFGITDRGLTIPLLCRGSQAAMYSINADVPQKDWFKYRTEYIGELQILATYLHSARQELAQEDETPELTARESEVLTWTAAGKSYWEISMILGISERTVRFFMTNTRNKMGVVTNSQAVAQGVWRGIIPL